MPSESELCRYLKPCPFARSSFCRPVCRYLPCFLFSLPLPCPPASRTFESGRHTAPQPPHCMGAEVGEHGVEQRSQVSG